MARKRCSDEDCLWLLREIELQLSSVSDVPSACRFAGISDATYYTRRKKFGGMGRSQLAELKALEKENSRLKKIERPWREGSLQLPRRHKRRKQLYHTDSSIIRLKPTHPNHFWVIDLIHDGLGNGRNHKMLTILDEFTWQALAVTVRTRMEANDVLEVLCPLLLRHGLPEHIRSENGPSSRPKH